MHRSSPGRPQAIIVFATLLVGLAIVSCQSDGGNNATALRSVGTATPREELTLTLLPGAFLEDAPGDAALLARAAAPVGRFRVRGGAEVDTAPFVLALENVHARAQIQVRAVTLLGDGDAIGCPEIAASRATIPCAQEMDEGQRQLFCEPPPVEPPQQGNHRLIVTLPIEPCREVEYSWALPPEEVDTPLVLVVIGATSSLAQLEGIVEETRDLEADAYVLLGDIGREVTGAGGLAVLQERLRDLEVATVVLPGEEELIEEEPLAFARIFGPLHHRFELKGTTLLPFYSADGQLGERGLIALRDLLRDVPPQRTLVALTHTPPLDPSGYREQGFRSRLQGSQVASLLYRAGTDLLLAGHVRTSDEEEIGEGLEMVVVGTTGSALGEDGQYLIMRRAPGQDIALEWRTAP